MGICELANTPFYLFLGLATYEYGISTQHLKLFPNEHSDKKTIKLVHCQNWGAQFNKVDEERFFDARYFPQGVQIVAAEGQ